MTEPTLEELIEELIAALNAALSRAQKRAKAKERRDQQALRTSDGANVVAGYGTLTTENPSDDVIDEWDVPQCDAFFSALKSRCEELQPGGPG